MGILGFLVNWLALSKYGQQTASSSSSQEQTWQQPISQENIYPQQQGGGRGYFTSKSHWTLLNELAELPEDEIETFLPQVCNIILDNETPDQYGIFNQLERVIVHKCAKSLTFGLKVSHLLKAASNGPSEGIFKSVLSNPSKEAKESRLREFQAHVEAATYCGTDTSDRMRYLRSTYCQDYLFMLSSLARLGSELKYSPPAQRNQNLRSALSQFNSLLLNRMLFKGKTIEELQHFYPGLPSSPSPVIVARQCPQAAAYSLHLPTQQSHENALRILQFVESECEVLPSKERCPYLVVAEVLEEPYSCGSSLLYCDGHISTEQLTMGVDSRQAHQHHHHHQQITNNPHIDSSDSNINNQQQQQYESTEHIKLFARTINEGEVHGQNAGTNKSSKNSDISIQDELASLHSVEDENNINNPFAHHAPSWDDASIIPNNNNINNHNNKENMDCQTYYQGDDSIINGELSSENKRECSKLDKYLPLFHNRGGQYYGGGDPSGYADQYQPHQQQQFAYYPQNTEQILSSSPPIQQPDMGYDPSYQPVAQQYPQYAYENDRKVFIKGRTWLEKKQMIKSMSVFGHLPGWSVKSFIVKSGDDLRKEMVALQLVQFFQNIFHTEGLDISLRPYRIISTGHMSGLVEFLEGCRSIDSIKKSCSTAASIKDYFEFCFGASYSPIYANAISNFVKSLAGYSLLTYVLQVKDRHNANILLDNDGHVVHIDFGFILGDSPGFNINFENAPFKLTREYIDAMGGIDSIAFKTFEDLFIRGFFALQRHVDAICTIVQMFYGPRRKNAADGLRSRLLFARTQDDVIGLIRDSLDSWRTKQYDWFQQRTNNILM